MSDTVNADPTLSWVDRGGFEQSDRGFLGRPEPMSISLDADCPKTAHSSLWRQAQLTAKHGLNPDFAIVTT